MDASARQEVSRQLYIVPIYSWAPCSDCLPYSRSRLAWCSVELFEMEGISLLTEQDYVMAFVVAPGMPTASWIRPGWRWEGEQDGTKCTTFMKPIRRSKPPPMLAGVHRHRVKLSEGGRPTSTGFHLTNMVLSFFSLTLLNQHGFWTLQKGNCSWDSELVIQIHACRLLSPNRA